jgi:hypothetical protein
MFRPVITMSIALDRAVARPSAPLAGYMNFQTWVLIQFKHNAFRCFNAGANRAR